MIPNNGIKNTDKLFPGSSSKKEGEKNILLKKRIRCDYSNENTKKAKLEDDKSIEIAILSGEIPCCDSIINATSNKHKKCVYLLCYNEDTTFKTLKESLLLAAKKGYCEVFEIIFKFLKETYDIDEIEVNGIYSIHYACSGDHLDLLRILIERYGCNASKTTKEKINNLLPIHQTSGVQSPLEIAIRTNSNKCLKYLIEHKSVNLKQFNQYTKMCSIHYACFYGNLEGCEMLLRKDTSLLWLRDETNNCLPVHFCLRSGKYDIFEWMMNDKKLFKYISGSYLPKLVAEIKHNEESLQNFDFKKYLSLSCRFSWFKKGVFVDKPKTSVVTNHALSMIFQRGEELDGIMKFYFEIDRVIKKNKIPLNTNDEELIRTKKDVKLSCFNRIPPLLFSYTDEIGNGTGVHREYFTNVGEYINNNHVFEHDENSLMVQTIKKAAREISPHSNPVEYRNVLEKTLITSKNEKGRLQQQLLMNFRNAPSRVEPDKKQKTDNNGQEKYESFQSSCLGIILAFSLINGCICPIPIDFTIIKLLFDIPPSEEDFISHDEKTYNEMIPYIKKCSAKDLKELGLTFSQTQITSPDIISQKHPPIDKGKIYREIEFVKNGSKINVNKNNLHQYIEKLSEHVLFWKKRPYINQFMNSFHSIIEKRLLKSLFTPEEVYQLLTGIKHQNMSVVGSTTLMQLNILSNSNLNVSLPKNQGSIQFVIDMESITKYNNVNESNKHIIEWFWSIMKYNITDPFERSRLLLFFTGCPILPWVNVKEKIKNFILQIKDDYYTDGCYPLATTCINNLILPKYSSRDKLLEKLKEIIKGQKEGLLTFQKK